MIIHGIMCIVIDPKEKIKEYLIKWGYLPIANSIGSEHTHDTLINAAAYVYNDFLGVNLEEQGCCWASNVKGNNLISIICNALSQIEKEFSCYNSKQKSNKDQIIDKSKELINN